MFRSSLILLILSYLLLSAFGFETKVGPAKVVLKDYNLNEKDEITESGLFLYRAFIFPYKVYEIDSKGSSIKEAKTYVFVKLAYEVMNQTLKQQGRSFYRVNQYEILYQKIPEIVLFEGGPNQYMELIHEDPSLFNSHFIIKNVSHYINTKAAGIMDLHFYSIQITKYIQLSIRNAQKDMRSELQEENVKKLLKESPQYTLDSINNNQTERNEFILRYFLVNESSTTYFGQLFYNEMTRTIDKQTVWFSLFDGFSTYFASAVLRKGSTQNETLIDLWIIIMREGKEKRVQHIKEPMSYLNISSIKYLKLCKSQNKLKLLLADHHNVFVVDITTHLWTVDLFEIGLTFTDLILDNSCELLKVNEQSITKIHGVTKVKFAQKVRSVATLHNVFVFCLESNVCKIYLKNIFKEISSITPNRTIDFLECSQIIFINGTNITHQISLRQKWGQLQYFQQIGLKDRKSQLIGNYSGLYKFIYPYEAYLNKTQIRSSQLDRIFYYHLQSFQNHQLYHIPRDYYDFQKLLSASCSNFDIGQTSQKITINSNSNWSVCAITVTTNSLIQLKIVPNNTQTKMYVCETSFQNVSINPQINCQPYTSLNEQKSYYLPNNKLVRFYVLRTVRQYKFPTFYLRDIEKQQILYASTIFFNLMLVLSVSFFLVIVFIVIRPILVALMIYYGWRPDLTVPTYPLTWFQLKIKIKRLVQTKFLKYVAHQPTSQGQDNHCCFCLQNLMKGVIIAQLYCLHQFHKECFNEWIKNEPNLRCPTCRRQFTRQQLNDFRNSHNLIES